MASAVGPNGFGRFTIAVRINIDQHHVGALGRQATGDAASDIGRAARHQSDLSVEQAVASQ
jgi:hypothetical protein